MLKCLYWIALSISLCTVCCFGSCTVGTGKKQLDEKTGAVRALSGRLAPVVNMWEISHSDIFGITTKAPCEAALMGERHVRIEISDFVMHTFVPAAHRRLSLRHLVWSRVSKSPRKSERKIFCEYDGNACSYQRIVIES